jgi:hypothetical protein
LDLKVQYPEECDAILKKIKKGKIRKGQLGKDFADKHVNHNLDIMAREGLLKRSYETVDGIDYIVLECSNKDVKFKQGRRNYPKTKGGQIF